MPNIFNNIWQKINPPVQTPTGESPTTYKARMIAAGYQPTLTGTRLSIWWIILFMLVGVFPYLNLISIAFFYARAVQRFIRRTYVYKTKVNMLGIITDAYDDFIADSSELLKNRIWGSISLIFAILCTAWTIYAHIDMQNISDQKESITILEPNLQNCVVVGSFNCGNGEHVYGDKNATMEILATKADSMGMFALYLQIEHGKKYLTILDEDVPVFADFIVQLNDKYNEWLKVVEQNNIQQTQKDFPLQSPNCYISVERYENKWAFSEKKNLHPVFVKMNKQFVVLFAAPKEDEYSTVDGYNFYFNKKQLQQFVKTIQYDKLQQIVTRKTHLENLLN